jgi:hypothetical protein
MNNAYSKQQSLTQDDILNMLNVKTAEYGIDCSFINEHITKRAYYAGGFNLHENVSLLILNLRYEKVKKGLPYFSINSKVFARNFIMTPFRIIGLAHRRIKTGMSEIDKKFDFYFSRKYKKEEIEKMYSFILDGSLFYFYRTLIDSNFSGSVEYDSEKINFETTKVPKNETELHKIYLVADFIAELGKKLDNL